MTTRRARLRTAVAILFLATSACTHVQRLSTDPDAIAAWQQRVNDDLRGRSAVILLHDGSKLEARDVTFARQQLSWIATDAHTRSARLAEVHEVSFRSHTRGALDGVLLAGLIGAPSGALLVDSASLLGAAAAGVASIGLLVIPIAAATGSRIAYRIEPSGADSKSTR